jgi:zinc protease
VAFFRLCSLRRDERPQCAGENRLCLKIVILGLLLTNGVASAIAAASGVNKRDLVERATLSNGLRVVVVQDSLAPVVTIEMSVLAGGNESPSEFPGMAHAQEHMAFRGCTEMTSDQTAAIYSELGGQDNASTEQTVTHYYVTVALPDLDIALQTQAACMRGIDDSQQEWSQERGGGG